MKKKPGKQEIKEGKIWRNVKGRKSKKRIKKK